MSEVSCTFFPGGTVLGHPGDWSGGGSEEGCYIFPPSCLKDCGSSGS